MSSSLKIMTVTIETPQAPFHSPSCKAHTCCPIYLLGLISSSYLPTLTAPCSPCCRRSVPTLSLSRCTHASHLFIHPRHSRQQATAPPWQQPRGNPSPRHCCCLLAPAAAAAAANWEKRTGRVAIRDGDGSRRLVPRRLTGSRRRRRLGLRSTRVARSGRGTRRARRRSCGLVVLCCCRRSRRRASRP